MATPRNKPAIAGLFLGVAIGCRITSGAMLLPFAIMISQSGGLKKNIGRVAKFTITTCMVGGLLFLPVFLKYGMSFFTYYDVPYPAIPEVLYKLSIGVWGVIGFLGLITATCLLFVSDRMIARKYLFPRAVNEKYVIAWLIAVDLYIIAYLKLPMESGYLIPMVPFVILLFGKYLFDKAFTFFAVTLIVAPFIANISPAHRLDAPTESSLAITFHTSGEDLIFDPLKGPVISYQSRRNNAMKFTESVLHNLDTIHMKTLIISGRWYTQMAVLRSDTSLNTIQFIDHINEKKLLKYIEDGYEIYYLPHQDQTNFLINDFDVKTFGAMPFMKAEN